MTRREFFGVAGGVGALAACGGLAWFLDNNRQGAQIAELQNQMNAFRSGTRQPIFRDDLLSTPTPNLVDNRTATVPATVTATAGNYWETPYGNPAFNDGNVWVLHNSDGAEVRKNLSGVIGFTPDGNLRVSDIAASPLGVVPGDASNFQAYLNSERNGFGKLAGFTDGTNDYNQYADHVSGPQVPAYSWMVHTGLNIEMPGIGRVTGGEGRAGMVLILNRTDDVYRFPTNSVRVEAGFQGWGRIWNGDPIPLQETESRLVNHFRTRLGQGVPESGFIGQCDQGVENCDSVTVVTVERMQWGNNADGTPRHQFRLIRAETVPAVK